jgi:hypothetical protein
MTPLTDPAAVREAQIREHVHRQAEFYQHFLIYLVVNIGLWSINAYQVFVLLSPKTGWWAFFTTFGWGIGVLVHWAAVFLVNNAYTRAWEERKVAEFIAREQRK